MAAGRPKKTVEESVAVPVTIALDSIENVSAYLETVVADIKVHYELLASSSHPVSRAAAGAIWGALVGLKRDLGNSYGVKVNID